MAERGPPFTVTADAMRPASDRRECFYCQVPIGSPHDPECTLIRKRVTVRMVVDYVVDVPASWDKEAIEFHRNESSWCADNALDELKRYSKEDGCLCPYAHFEVVQAHDVPFLREQ